MSLFDSGVRPIIDDYLKKKSEEIRDYGDYWSASSAGYCMRKVIFDRLGVPKVKEEPRKQRVFEAGHVFHKWYQDITKAAGVSLAQELELIDNELMIKGHIDDLVLIDGHLILYDAKTQNSRAFNYKRPEMSHYHKMQLGTYMYMLRKADSDEFALNIDTKLVENTLEGFISDSKEFFQLVGGLTEARILKISKDDLRMSEEQLLWTPALEKEVYEYWSTLNGYWESKKLPKCTCADREGGFMARETYNDYFYKEEPCSLAWYEEWKSKSKETEDARN